MSFFRVSQFAANNGDKSVLIIKQILWVTHEVGKGFRAGSPLLREVGKVIGTL